LPFSKQPHYRAYSAMVIMLNCNLA